MNEAPEAQPSLPTSDAASADPLPDTGCFVMIPFDDGKHQRCGQPIVRNHIFCAEHG